MILGLIIIGVLITGTLYCCLVVASRYDDMMGYDEEDICDGKKN